MSFHSFCQKIWTCILLKIGEDKIWESNNVKLLGVNIDKELKSDEHILTKCLKAYRKLSALTRLSRFVFLEKQGTLSKAFIEYPEYQF